MRGRDTIYSGDILSAGITPAYAGKRLPRLLFLALHRDHPRVCGEERFWWLSVIPVKGSPPRMRGRAEYKAEQQQTYGITPAYAGKS